MFGTRSEWVAKRNLYIKVLSIMFIISTLVFWYPAWPLVIFGVIDWFVIYAVASPDDQKVDED